MTPERADKIRNILARPNTSAATQDMDLPGFRMHPLTGDLRGFWSVTVRANWQAVFRFEDGDARSTSTPWTTTRSAQPWRPCTIPRTLA